MLHWGFYCLSLWADTFKIRPMLKWLLEWIAVSRNGFSEFLKIEFQNVRFSNIQLAEQVAAIIITFIIFRVGIRIFRKNKFSQKQSGYSEIKKHSQGLFSKTIHFIPRLLTVSGVALLVVALAEPVINQRKEEIKITESRIRVELRDTSGSMEQAFPGTEISKAEVGARAHLDFLKMRKGKNDRVSFWVFASNPYLIQDFIVDDELYFSQVVDAPWISYSQVTNYVGYPPIPSDRYNRAEGETGGTDLVLALSAVIKQVDEDDESNKGSRKSLLIITDGEPSGTPANQLDELKKRNFIPYVIFIRSAPLMPTDPTDDSGTQSSPAKQASSLPQFIQDISKWGGLYFDVADKNSLNRAYQAIDKLETTKVSSRIIIFKQPIFEKFILTAICILLIALILGLILEPFGVYP